jgi:6-phosphogluconolactonase (cycloisomerase 2 family)
LKLRNNGGDDLIITSNGAFTFATTWSRLSPYDVTIATSPNTPPQSCQITHGSGALTRDENTVRVDCDTDRFAYVANAADNSVTEFSIDSLTGKLKAVQGATFPTGTGPRAIVSDPLRRFIYVANFDSNNISGYVVNDTTGALTPVAGSPFFAGTNPSALAIDSEGMFLYAANYGSNSISGFTIQSNGSLASITGSPFATGLGPKSLATTPAQQCCSLYVANSLGNTVSAFAYDSDTGVLSSQPGSPYATGTTPTSVFVNRTAEFVFVANYDSNTVSMFDLQGGIGSLVERAVSPIATGITPCALGPAPGAFSVVYRATSGVSVFDYDYTDFTQPPVEIGPATPAGAGACSFVVPITSPYVYVVNEIANTISAFYWKYNYTPVESIGTYDVGNNPRAIAIRNNVADLDALGIPH